MKRAVAAAALLFSSLCLSACPPIDGVFDLSTVPDGRYDEPYSGQVTVAEYDGAALFTLVGGELPEGLEMNEAGAIEGTPLWAGPVTITVLATAMKRVEDFQGDISFEIRADQVEGAFLGYRHDQLTNMTERFGLQRDIWLRVTEVGVDDMSEYAIDLGIYLPGDNGIAENGMNDGMQSGCGLPSDCYDDVRIGDVSFADIEVEFSSWEANEETYVNPPGYPSQHLPEGDPPTVNAEGMVNAGVDTGEANLRLIHEDYGEVNTRVLIVPPDWCPDGEHVEGGPGDDGFCA